MMLINEVKEEGLTIYISATNLRELSIEVLSSEVEKITTGSFFNRCDPFNSFKTSKPFFMGMFRSSKMTRGIVEV